MKFTRRHQHGIQLRPLSIQADGQRGILLVQHQQLLLQFHQYQQFLFQNITFSIHMLLKQLLRICSGKRLNFRQDTIREQTT
jgi:hypothetical protein